MVHQKLRGQDSNLRPPGYEPDELPLLYPASIFTSTVVYYRGAGASRICENQKSRPIAGKTWLLML